MSVAKTVVDDRWRRYCKRLDEELTGYPMYGSLSVTDRRLAVRFLSVLDAAALLFDDAQAKRLMSFLHHMYVTDQDFLPNRMTRELRRMTQDQFMWFVVRQCALVLACNGTVEEMTALWFRDADPSAVVDTWLGSGGRHR